MASKEKTGLVKLLELAGTKSNLAKILGVYPQAVNAWFIRGQVSPKIAVQIEKAFDGKIKKHELRPDIYPPEEYIK